MNHLILGAAATACLATTALANPLPAPRDQQVKLSISTAGLNLADHNDRAKLRNRMNKAIAEACNPADRFIITALPADRKCREQALRDAEPAIERMAQAALANQVAQN